MADDLDDDDIPLWERQESGRKTIVKLIAVGIVVASVLTAIIAIAWMASQ
jgi:hypothetical protein